MNELRVTLVQANLHWEDVSANISHFEAMLTSLTDTDIVVLPEMFTTGFSMNAAALAGESFIRGVTFMKELAAAKRAAVCGSLIGVEGGNYYNRFVWVGADGEFLHYDKRHLFTMGDEANHYSKGRELLQINFRGWQIRPLICYDLRFPVWSRNSKTQPYDLLLYVANWPQKRIIQWSKLLQARAIENSAYVVGVNRIGVDGNGYAYNGMSMSVDFLGEASIFDDNVEKVHTVIFDKEKMHHFRTSFPVLNDADDFEIKLQN